ncbi:hypothetical protein [Armatimonas rosea]|uniref:Uncharacterized protein n=1 Tax=Armatimonas rosea TaxID=685828 RepID=A0A7W9SRH9_ARMRO|nr:hypothetical protein [Armatimonas rosea]MBB6051457.1 hypothetical protein [Armatimonas rosea]
MANEKWKRAEGIRAKAIASVVAVEKVVLPMQEAIKRVHKEVLEPQLMAGKSALIERSPSDRYCARFFKQAEDFRANLSSGNEMQATLVSPDGTVIILHHIDSSRGQEIICTGANEQGKKVQITVSISAAVLKLEEVSASANLAKQERVGFLAQVREHQQHQA